MSSPQTADKVVGWERFGEAGEEIRLRHRNSRFLPGLELDAGLEATQDLQRALSDKAIVFVALPS